MEVGELDPPQRELEHSSSEGRGRYFLMRLGLPCMNWDRMTWASRSGSRGSRQSPMVIPR